MFPTTSKLHGQAVDPGVPAVVVAIAQLGRLIFLGTSCKKLGVHEMIRKQGIEVGVLSWN